MVERHQTASLLAGVALGMALAAAGAFWALYRYAGHEGLAGRVDPRIIDLGSLALNAVLLVALVWRTGLRAENDDEGTA